MSTSVRAWSFSPTFTWLRFLSLPTSFSTPKSSASRMKTVRDRQGTLPLLTPMSEVAGRMSVQVGAAYLEKGAWR